MGIFWNTTLLLYLDDSVDMGANHFKTFRSLMSKYLKLFLEVSF